MYFDFYSEKREKRRESGKIRICHYNSNLKNMCFFDCSSMGSRESRMGIGRFLDRVIVDLYGLVSFELIFMEK